MFGTKLAITRSLQRRNGFHIPITSIQRSLHYRNFNPSGDGFSRDWLLETMTLISWEDMFLLCPEIANDRWIEVINIWNLFRRWSGRVTVFFENGPPNWRFMATRIKEKYQVRFRYVANLSENWDLEEKSRYKDYKRSVATRPLVWPENYLVNHVLCYKRQGNRDYHMGSACVRYLRTSLFVFTKRTSEQWFV